jgi:hypothetical protein
MLELPQCSTWLEDSLTVKDFYCPIRDMDMMMMVGVAGYPDTSAHLLEHANQRLAGDIRNETLRLYNLV